MKRLLISLLGVSIIVAVLLCGCAKPTAAPATTPAMANTLDIGVATPLTGPMSFTGTTIQNAILLSIDDQNKEGGVTIGGQNYKLNPVVRDTKQDLVLGKSIAEELIFTKVSRLLWGLSFLTP